jgi:hypothetical protein
LETGNLKLDDEELVFEDEFFNKLEGVELKR